MTSVADLLLVCCVEASLAAMATANKIERDSNVAQNAADFWQKQAREESATVDGTGKARRATLEAERAHKHAQQLCEELDQLTALLQAANDRVFHTFGAVRARWNVQPTVIALDALVRACATAPLEDRPSVVNMVMDMARDAADDDVPPPSSTYREAFEALAFGTPRRYRRHETEVLRLLHEMQVTGVVPCRQMCGTVVRFMAQRAWHAELEWFADGLPDDVRATMAEADGPLARAHAVCKQVQNREMEKTKRYMRIHDTGVREGEALEVVDMIPHSIGAFSGAGHRNITELRDEFGVRIVVGEDSRCYIYGELDAVAEARAYVEQFMHDFPPLMADAEEHGGSQATYDQELEDQYKM